MLRLKGISQKWEIGRRYILLKSATTGLNHVNINNPISQSTSIRFLNIFQMGSKDAIEKERARLKDELNRGYFADMSDLSKHAGKIAVANQTMIPAATALKFPTLETSYPDGKKIKLPFSSHAIAGLGDQPKATLLCLAFRANSQAMVESWIKPFHEAFNDSSNIHIYEVSCVESWFLSLTPIKQLLLRMMKKSTPVSQRQRVYSFGDHYYFRKELKILNLLTGYIFLLDNCGRIRWQGFGTATEEELSWLLSCTSLLLDEK